VGRRGRRAGRRPGTCRSCVLCPPILFPEIGWGRGEREQQRDATGLDGVEVRDRELWREEGTIQRDTEWEGSES